MHKTNAMRVLDARKIQYTPFEYDPAIHSGDGVAAVLGVPANHVFKTLVVLRERGRPILAIVPSDRELDLKRMAAAAREKRVRMATQREAEAKTGLLVGGISALALLDKGFDVFLDASAQGLDELYVSAGQRGVNLRLRVADLAAVTRATIGPLTHQPAADDAIEVS
jgi:Cys-tRNA(Pro)/Cys-tRNA(Cys) deacylase